MRVVVTSSERSVKVIRLRLWFPTLVCIGYAGAVIGSVGFIRVTDGRWPTTEYLVFVAALAFPSLVAWLHYAVFYRLELTLGSLVQHRLFGLATRRMRTHALRAARLGSGGYTNHIPIFIIEGTWGAIELQFNMYARDDLRVLVEHLDASGVQIEPDLARALE